MKIELLETEREYLEQTLRYNVELIQDFISDRDNPKDIISWGQDLVRIGQILEKLKKTYEPVPNLNPKKKGAKK